MSIEFSIFSGGSNINFELPVRLTLGCFSPVVFVAQEQQQRNTIITVFVLFKIIPKV